MYSSLFQHRYKFNKKLQQTYISHIIFHFSNVCDRDIRFRARATAVDRLNLFLGQSSRSSVKCDSLSALVRERTNRCKSMVDRCRGGPNLLKKKGLSLIENRNSPSSQNLSSVRADGNRRQK